MREAFLRLQRRIVVVDQDPRRLHAVLANSISQAIQASGVGARVPLPKLDPRNDFPTPHCHKDFRRATTTDPVGGSGLDALWQNPFRFRANHESDFLLPLVVQLVLRQCDVETFAINENNIVCPKRNWPHNLRAAPRFATFQIPAGRSRLFARSLLLPRKETPPDRPEASWEARGGSSQPGCGLAFFRVLLP